MCTTPSARADGLSSHPFSGSWERLSHPPALLLGPPEHLCPGQHREEDAQTGGGHRSGHTLLQPSHTD